MGSGAKNPGLPSNADAKAGPTRCVAMLGRFKGKQVPFGSRLLVTCKMDVHVVVEQALGGEGVNPSENYARQNWIISSNRGENDTYLKPPPRF